jgi:uncharacterized membrane protein
MRKLAWVVFGLMLLFAVIFLMSTVTDLPARVASHFDSAGQPNAYMTQSFYTKFLLAMAVGLPLAMAAVFSAVFSSAQDMRIPNRDHWLAPERVAQTRAALISHSLWFCTLMVAMVCYVHWLVLAAHRNVPPHLSTPMMLGGVLVFFLATVGWIAALLATFRLPRSQAG